MPWLLRWDGEVYREGDLTIDQAERIAAKVDGNVDWSNVHPVTHIRAIVAVMHSDRTGEPYDKVYESFGQKVCGDVIRDVFDFETDDGLPTEYVDGNPTPADAASTDSSSLAPADSDGPLT